MKYVVLIDGQAIEVEVDGDHVTVAGQTYSATLSAIPGTPLRQLLLDGRPLTLSVEPLGRGRWALTPGGERWEVEVLDERTRHIRSLAGGGDQRRAAGSLKAPDARAGGPGAGQPGERWPPAPGSWCWRR